MIVSLVRISTRLLGNNPIACLESVSVKWIRACLKGSNPLACLESTPQAFAARLRAVGMSSLSAASSFYLSPSSLPLLSSRGWWGASRLRSAKTSRCRLPSSCACFTAPWLPFDRGYIVYAYNIYIYKLSCRRCKFQKIL